MSTRAVTESAVRGGVSVVAVDFFGDRDQAAAAESYALGRDLGLPLTAAGLARAARRLGARSVVYGANLENHPAVIAGLGRRHDVLGNEAAAVRKVRDWRRLRRFCDEAGIAHPVTLLAGEEYRAREGGGRWLRKRVHSGGGHGVRLWDGEPLDRAHLLQGEVEGRAASASFVADGRAARLFALNEQIIGDRELGACGYAWCGNILPFAADTELVAAVAEIATLLTRRFGLRGVNGLDLVVAGGADRALVPHLIEVNPRFTASMELAELAGGRNVFALHLEGCAGRLPGMPPAERQAAGLSPGTVVAAGGGAPAGAVLPAGRFIGKAVLFAARPVLTPETGPWLEERVGGIPAIRDVPRAGERIAAGHPVCTVFAVGSRDRDACLTELHEAAATMDERLQHGGRRREVRRERATDVDQWAHA